MSIKMEFDTIKSPINRHKIAISIILLIKSYKNVDKYNYYIYTTYKYGRKS